MLRSRSLIRCLQIVRARVYVPYIFWIFTSHRIKQLVTTIKHLIVARTVDGFALKMIPTANIIDF